MSNCSYIFDNGTVYLTNQACNNVVGSPNLLTGQVEYPYDYMINSASTHAFLALFVLLTVAHFSLGTFWRLWWTLPTLTLGGAVEAVGWGGRMWSARVTYWDPNNGGYYNDPGQGFIMQICCLVIAPTFFSAANYTLLSRLTQFTNGVHCSITYKSLSIIFITADVICLVIQGVGGGIAGSADTISATKSGLHIMAVGVIIQMVVTVFFLAFWIEYVYRFYHKVPVRKQYDLIRPFLFWKRKTSTSRTTSIDSIVKVEAGGASASHDPLEITPKNKQRIGWMLGALLFTTILIVVRSIYRCDELLSYNGRSGTAYSNQSMFLGMDATLMMILLVAYAIVHPGLLDGRRLF